MSRRSKQQTEKKSSRKSYKRALTQNFVILAIIPLLIFGGVVVNLLTKEFENAHYLCYPQSGIHDCRFPLAPR